jgi:hypothetical protein
MVDVVLAVEFVLVAAVFFEDCARQWLLPLGASDISAQRQLIARFVLPFIGAAILAAYFLLPELGFYTDVIFYTDVMQKKITMALVGAPVVLGCNVFEVVMLTRAFRQRPRRRRVQSRGHE